MGLHGALNGGQGCLCSWTWPLGGLATATAAAACCGKHLPAALPAAAGFLLYVAAALASTLYLIFRVSPEVQTSNILVYVAICSIVGSLSGAWRWRVHATHAADVGDGGWLRNVEGCIGAGHMPLPANCTKPPLSPPPHRAPQS